MLMVALTIGMAAAGSSTLIAPDSHAAEVALYLRLNGQCDGQLESETCISHPRSARVRAMKCTPAGPESWDCRYKRQIHYICGSCKFKWDDVRSTFTLDQVTGGWRIENDTEI